MRNGCLLCFLFWTNLAWAQLCPCRKMLDSLVGHLRENYPGFEHASHQADWAAWLQQSGLKINEAETPKICADKLQAFLAIFNDGHLTVRHRGSIFKTEKVERGQPAWPEIEEDSVKKWLDGRMGKDSLEGIWESYDVLYKVFIRKNQQTGGYVGYLLETVNQNWQKGEVKMVFEPTRNSRLRLRYFMSAHKARFPSFSLENNVLEIKNRIVFQKLYPKVDHPVAFESFVSGRFGLTEDFLPWNESVFYIQLQNITAGNKPHIDSLLRKWDATIRKSKMLILDLRDNEGGDFTCFENLWPYILIDKAIVYGTTYRCTQANLEAYRRQIGLLEAEIIPEFKEMALEMERHLGQDWTIPNDTLEVTQPSVLPQKVVLLVNGKCKSSTENFILSAMQSPKVVVAGEPTGGVVDYEETVDFAFLGFDLLLQMPIGRSNRLPYFPLNGKGIEPTIKLKSKNRAWQPWVREVVRRVRIQD